LALRQSLAFSISILLLGLASPVFGQVGGISNTPAPGGGASAVVNPADDPWLAEDGPAVPAPAQVAHEVVVDRWGGPERTPHERSAALRHTRLELGLGNLPAPAAALLRSASQAEPDLYTGLARDLAPGVPAIQIANARALWSAGDTGAAVNAMVDTALAAVTDLEVQIWLIENVSVILIVVVLIASLGFIALAALVVFPDAAHDVGDLFSSRTPGFARAAALGAILLVPVALGEGVVGLALGLFTMGFIYGSGRQRNALAMAAVFLIVGLYPLAQIASVATTLVDRDPVVKSVLAVSNGTDSTADAQRLEAVADLDVAAAHALAYRARRQGLEERSREHLDGIIASFPEDAVALANRGNIEMRRGNTAAAIDYFERSAELIDSPILLFNLSQAYAAAFRMEESESTLVRAQKVGDEEVAALSSLDDARLVADLGLPFGLLRNRFVSAALARNPRSLVVEALAPGMLGERWFITASAFALVVLVGLLFADRFDHASRCTRCGHRICTRCADTVWSDEVCEDCHHLLQYPEATDPSLRMARLQALSRRDVRLGRVWLLGSLLIPGVAGFASKRPDLAMFGLLLFGWTAAWLAWPGGVLEDPMLMGSAAWIFFAIPGVFCMLAYAGVVAMSLVARKNL
jgi:hypothetical protein